MSTKTVKFCSSFFKHFGTLDVFNSFLYLGTLELHANGYTLICKTSNCDPTVTRV